MRWRPNYNSGDEDAAASRVAMERQELCTRSALDELAERRARDEALAIRRRTTT